ncbi:DUF4125 family protein [Bifidobacterium gallicum]|uniref:DUF4125 domain-containing protein n=1 Tax=Bifidobacterium gallicum DSM 20093 = LMG 11596 TaxID=561180 RepID=D1NV68_9BIFI|nr:DUF4125 family protein [Bifidobacterium gallicum]EFA22719.1 hypothetical protein BIFGAL_03751 [Bifidobacterium gallicum DSM 20093 = LMG 11596]KFI59669.1 hypothetical protein BGLCM_0338 [Bifidobacterium gallicum DSM 20093 = LMG 11596]
MAREQTQQRIIDTEWQMFQRTQGREGRAQCQNDRPQFELMRLSQFMTWPEPLLDSYLTDLEQAQREGRNLVTEKYARMMASTDREIYEREIKPFLQPLSEERQATQEHVIAVQVAWARQFRKQYPNLGNAMRVLTTDEDSAAGTSFETYLRGELSTYSPRTIDRYAHFVDTLQSDHKNLTEMTIRNTVQLSGYDDLPDAEAAQQQ